MFFLAQELNESLWQAKRDTGMAENAWEEKLRQVREKMELSVSSAKAEAFQEAYAAHCTLLRQLFPEVSVKECGIGKEEQWLEEFESEAQEILGSRKEEVSERAYSLPTCGFGGCLRDFRASSPRVECPASLLL